METPNQEQKKGIGAIWIILLFLSIILNIFQWRNHTTTISTYEQKVDTLVVERVNVEKELNDTKNELNKYQGISSNLDSLLKEANAKISDQEKKLRIVTHEEQNAVELNKKLKQQLVDLQSLRDEYLGRIDSLLIVSKQLKADKEQLTTSLETVSKNLQTTVNAASFLKVENVRTSSFKRKGNGKYIETALAKRMHKITVCFDVLENAIAKPGDRTVYLKITEPGGKVVGNRSGGSSSFKTTSGEEVLFTVSTTIAYAGARQNVCLNYEEQNDKMFPAGNYNIEAYVDGYLAGSSTYSLK